MPKRENNIENESNNVLEIKLEEWDFMPESEVTKEIKLENFPIKKEPVTAESIDQDRFPCTECGKALRSLVKLQFHLLRKHSKTLEIEQKCPECDKVFRNRKNLKSHMIYHTGEKPYHCQFCEKAFVRNSHLKSHNLTHSKDSPELAELIEKRKVDCSECGKTLRDKQCLKSHMKHIHSDEKPYSCDQCDMCFKMASNLTVHKLTHSGRYSCGGCESKFYSKLQLKEHQQISCIVGDS